MKQIKIAVVGVGYLGGHHARIISELQTAKLVGIVDTDTGRAEELAKKHGTTAYGSIDGVLDKIDAAVVAVPTVNHFDVSMRLLDAGKDLLIEKPIASTVAEADHLLEAAAKKRAILQVGHLERFNGAIIGVAKYLSTPIFIESHRLGPFAARGTDVDVALDLMIHDIDVLLSIVRSPVSSIQAVGVPVLSDNVDIANARLEFESGCVANITASRVSVEKMRKLRIFQPNSYLSLDYQTQKLKYYSKSNGNISLEDIKSGNPIPGVKIENVEIKKEEPLRTELEAFMQSIRNRSTPIVSGKDGRNALEIAVIIKEKAQEKLNMVKLHPLH